MADILHRECEVIDAFVPAAVAAPQRQETGEIQFGAVTPPPVGVGGFVGENDAGVDQRAALKPRMIVVGVELERKEIGIEVRAARENARADRGPLVRRPFVVEAVVGDGEGVQGLARRVVVGCDAGGAVRIPLRDIEDPGTRQRQILRIMRDPVGGGGEHDMTFDLFGRSLDATELLDVAAAARSATLRRGIRHRRQRAFGVEPVGDDFPIAFPGGRLGGGAHAIDVGVRQQKPRVTRQVTRIDPMHPLDQFPRPSWCVCTKHDDFSAGEGRGESNADTCGFAKSGVHSERQRGRSR